jgi:hypothetical protein
MDFSVFDWIARENAWGDPESISGPGSSLLATASLRRGLEEALARLEIRSLVDAPCGDRNWMKHLRYRFDKYIGIDLVPSVIERSRAVPLLPGYHLQVGNLVTDILPAADALLCRDCLVHLPYKAIEDALSLWRVAGFRFVMATTFPGHVNSDCDPGGWRPLDLEAAPFHLSSPEILIPDNDGLLPPWDAKSLGVWRLGAE